VQYCSLASAGRVIFWMCLATGVGCLISALHILLAWPEPPPDPLEAFSINTIDFSSVGGGPLRLAVR